MATPKYACGKCGELVERAPNGLPIPCPRCGSLLGFFDQDEAPKPQHSASQQECPECGEMVDPSPLGLPVTCECGATLCKTQKASPDTSGQKPSACTRCGTRRGLKVLLSIGVLTIAVMLVVKHQHAIKKEKQLETEIRVREGYKELWLEMAEVERRFRAKHAAKATSTPSTPSVPIIPSRPAGAVNGSKEFAKAFMSRAPMTKREQMAAEARRRRQEAIDNAPRRKK